MKEIKHRPIAVAGTAFVALAIAPTAFAAPSGYFDNTSTFTEDTGIACVSGGTSFEVMNHATVHRYGPSFSDERGNFVKDILYVDTDGTFSNSATGASIVYKARSIEHDSIAIPGDFSSAFTAVTTGEMQLIAPGAGVVWQNSGRVVDIFDPNGDETLVWNGPHDDLVYGFLGDTSVAESLRVALSA